MLGRRRGGYLAVIATFALGACSGGPAEPTVTDERNEAALNETARVPPPARNPKPRAVVVDRKDALLDFHYEYPAQAAEITELRAVLQDELRAAEADARTQARADRDEAKGAGYEYRTHGLHVEWTIDGSTEQLIAMTALISAYSGGAHPNNGYTSLLWDRAADKRIELADVTTSPGALYLAAKPLFCASLDKERAQRRGGSYTPNRGDPFGACPNLAELSVSLVGAPGQPFNRIRIIAAQYVAGSYAEGAYQIDVPVTPAIIRTINPAWRASFAVEGPLRTEARPVPAKPSAAR